MKTLKNLSDEIFKLGNRPLVDRKEISSARRNYPFFGFVEIGNEADTNFVLFCANDCPYSLGKLHHGEAIDELNTAILWSHFAKSANLIFDVGAHIGLFSLIAASVNKSSTIYAFEPNPIVYSRLVINVNSNRANNIKPVFKAVSSSSGEAFIWFSSNYAYLSTAGTLESEFQKQNSSSVTIQKISLDYFFGEINKVSNLDLMKIDVEHHEFSVLSGAQLVLENSDPVIFIELLLESEFNQCNNLLQEHGYICFKINDSTLSKKSILHNTERFDNRLGRNYLFLKKSKLSYINEFL